MGAESRERRAYFSYDYYVVMDESVRKVSNLSIFPNPATDFIIIESDEKIKRITFFLINGEEIFRQAVNSNNP